MVCEFAGGGLLLRGFLLGLELSGETLGFGDLAGLEFLGDQIALRDASGVAFGRAEIQPFVGLDVVALYALARSIHRAQVVLGLRVILLGGASEPIDSFGGALRDAVPVQVQEPEVELRLRFAFLG